MSYPYNQFSAEQIEEVRLKLPHKNGTTYCEITIGVPISDAEIETALQLGIDPAEYIRRRVLMGPEEKVSRLSEQHKYKLPMFTYNEI